jgi:uncharacterized protein YegL
MPEEFPSIEAQIEDNEQQRTPCVLVLDCSDSMRSDGRIDQLNDGLAEFERALKADNRTRDRVQVLVIRVGGTVDIVQDWTDAEYFSAPHLSANGSTPLGAGMRVAMQKIREIKQLLISKSVSYTRPWVFLITDGEPNDAGWEEAAAETRRDIAGDHLKLWPLAVAGANTAKMKEFQDPSDYVYALKGANYHEFFEFLNNSLRVAAGGPEGSKAQISLPAETITIVR